MQLVCSPVAVMGCAYHYRKPPLQTMGCARKPPLQTNCKPTATCEKLVCSPKGAFQLIYGSPFAAVKPGSPRCKPTARQPICSPFAASPWNPRCKPTAANAAGMQPWGSPLAALGKPACSPRAAYLKLVCSLLSPCTIPWLQLVCTLQSPCSRLTLSPTDCNWFAACMVVQNFVCSLDVC